MWNLVVVNYIISDILNPLPQSYTSNDICLVGKPQNTLCTLDEIGKDGTG